MQPSSDPQILIIADNLIGSYSQLIGLAQAMKLRFEIIKVDYSLLRFLPNCFLINKGLMLTKDSKEKLSNLDYKPLFIFSAGRKAAIAALYLQKKLGKNLKIIQLMNPQTGFKNFTAIILPRHDFKEVSPNLKNNNIILTTGALNRVNEEVIKEESEKFRYIFTHPRQPDDKNKKIALLLGGSSRNSIFNKESALELSNIVTRIGNNMKAEIIVLNSRRTGENITEIIKNNLKCKNKFFAWQEVKENNPYLAILGSSDFFIVTGDSISMCSECCSTGKPVYIFDDKKLSSKKHRRFHQDLFKNNYARKLEKNLNILEDFKPQKLSETTRVANIILNLS